MVSQPLGAAVAAKQSRQTCIWGDGTELTKEHVLPQWLRRKLQPSEVSRRSRRFDIATGEIYDERVRQGSVFTVRPRVVCRSCNEGWMSDLEERTIPLLAPLVDGVTTVLSAADASLIAAWTMKTAIVAQHAGERVTSKAQAIAFRNSLTPDPATKIWMGHFGEPEGGNVWTYAWPWSRDIRRPELKPNSHLTIFAAGHLLLFVANSPDPDFAGFEPLGRAARRFVRVWPEPMTVYWPPRIRTSEDEVLHLREIFVARLNS